MLAIGFFACMFIYAGLRSEEDTPMKPINQQSNTLLPRIGGDNASFYESKKGQEIQDFGSIQGKDWVPFEEAGFSGRAIAMTGAFVETGETENIVVALPERIPVSRAEQIAKLMFPGEYEAVRSYVDPSAGVYVSVYRSERLAHLEEGGIFSVTWPMDSMIDSITIFLGDDV